MIRAAMWLKSTRTGELLGDLTTALGFDRNSVYRRPGMEMFLGNPVPADDPRLTAVYDNYRRNLTDICGVARGAHAAVVLCSVAVNLRDLPPLASLHRSDLSAEDLAKWESIYKMGGDLEADHRWQDAVRQYEAAELIDGHYAELKFRMARCLLKAGRSAEAKAQFELARDLDVLRFRADSRINTIVREVAAAQDAANIRFADTERALDESNPAAAGIAGEDLFYEHVHLTVEGNYVLARAALQQVAAALPQLAGKPGAVPSRQRCRDLLVLTPANEYEAVSNIVNVVSRPPFTNQLDHALRLAALRRQRNDLHREALLPQAVQSAQKAYEEALAQLPGDWNLHFRFGGLALQWNQPKLAEEHLRIALEKVPWNAATYTLLGSALAAQDQFDKAAAMYRRALEINSALAGAEKNLAVALAESGRVDEAMVHFHTALEIDPTFVEAHDNLGKLLAAQQQFDEALVHYRAALELDPDFAEAHDDIGQALFHQGLLDEADEHFRKAVEITPSFAEAHNNLALVSAKRGRLDEAIVHYRKALEIKPDYAGAHFNLGMVLAGSEQVDEAIAHFQKALEIKPDFIQARRSLEALGVKPP
jgi:tetratricopeptide (TPR) repeat protein